MSACFFYSNNGFSWRAADTNWSPAAGEVVFDTVPSSEQLAAAFPSYAAAAAAAVLAASAQAALAAGCQIVSTGNPSTLDGTYPVDAASQAYVNAEVTSILLNGTFTDGTSSAAWLDVSNAAHTFSLAQFKTLATALGAFVTGCLKVINGQSASLPAQPATIA